MSDHVRVDKQDGILSLVLARPEKKNALTYEMYEVLGQALLDANQDDDVRAVLISGEGSTFCAGNDIADFARVGAGDPDVFPTDEGGAPIFLRALCDAEKPLVAAVDGAAVGVGATMLLHCDFVYASTRARFHFPFVDLALVPEAGASLLLPRFVGYHRAARILQLGEVVSGQQLVDFGMVHRVVEPDALLETATSTAVALAAKPPEALRRTKMLMKREPEPLPDRIDLEVRELRQRLATPEAQAIFKAFLDRSPAKESAE